MPVRLVSCLLFCFGPLLGAPPVRAEPPPFYLDKARLLVYRAGGKEQPITRASDWPRRRNHILAAMEEVMGPLPDPGRKVPLAV
jgi:hypothetical protein